MTISLRGYFVAAVAAYLDVSMVWYAIRSRLGMPSPEYYASQVIGLSILAVVFGLVPALLARNLPARWMMAAPLTAAAAAFVADLSQLALTLYAFPGLVQIDTDIAPFILDYPIESLIVALAAGILATSATVVIAAAAWLGGYGCRRLLTH